jgi:hypothetical protein
MGGSFEQKPLLARVAKFEMVIVPLKVQYIQHTELNNPKAVMVSKFNVKPC